jgi:dihydroorotase
MPEPFDLILHGGRVIDPTQALDRSLDIGIRDGRVAAIEADLRRAPAGQLLDVAGALVTPGLIDVHCHVYEGTALGAPVREAGIGGGVTTLVDTGSAGYTNFEPFRRYIIEPTGTRIFAFLHIGSTGLAGPWEIRDRADINVGRTAEVARAHPSVVRGIKIRASGPGVAALGIEAFRLAKEAARAAGLPLMVHIGDPEGHHDQAATARIFDLLESGDIVTHMYAGTGGAIWDETADLFAQVRDTAAKGVYFDCAHGMFATSFRVAAKALEQGIVPFSISSDLSRPGQRAVVFSLLETMGKYLALGLPLPDVIRMTTANPARMIGEHERLGSLAVGRGAELSVLRAVEGDWAFEDTFGEVLHGRTALVPVATIQGSAVTTPTWGPHPWGWLPRSVGREDPTAEQDLPVYLRDWRERQKAR